MYTGLGCGEAPLGVLNGCKMAASNGGWSLGYWGEGLAVGYLSCVGHWKQPTALVTGGRRGGRVEKPTES